MYAGFEDGTVPFVVQPEIDDRQVGLIRVPADATTDAPPHSSHAFVQLKRRFRTHAEDDAGWHEKIGNRIYESAYGEVSDFGHSNEAGAKWLCWAAHLRAVQCYNRFKREGADIIAARSARVISVEHAIHAAYNM